MNLTICILTHNSQRTLQQVLKPLSSIADEIILLDSGSNDETLNIAKAYGISIHSSPYQTHGSQMNKAIALASHDWVFCLDSDEIADNSTIDFIKNLKQQASAPDINHVWRISRYWYVLGQQVRAIYPVSSPDYPVRLFNRRIAQFNDRPVDDKVENIDGSQLIYHVIPGHIRHDTFYSLHEMQHKLNNYTTRLNQYHKLKPSLWRGVFSAVGAGFKWYLIKGAWRDGRIGVATGLYALQYSFIKYFKAWYQAKDKS